MSDSVAQQQIRAFVERILRLKEEAKSINDDIKEVYAEAKGNGFDKTVLGKLVNYVEKRAKDPNAVSEGEALFGLYLAAYDGNPSHTHAYAREDDYAGDITPEAVEQVRRMAAPQLAAMGIDPATGEFIEPQPAMAAQTAGSETAVANSTPGSGAGTVDAGGANWPSEMTTASPANEPETIPPAADPTVVVSEAGDDRSAGTASATVVAFRINTKTHFANSKGLPRLHGCLKPEACGGSHRSLCFGCSIQHDGPAHQEGAA